jgi:hypothetical protein
MYANDYDAIEIKKPGVMTGLSVFHTVKSGIYVL